MLKWLQNQGKLDNAKTNVQMNDTYWVPPDEDKDYDEEEENS